MSNTGKRLSRIAAVALFIGVVALPVAVFVLAGVGALWSYAIQIHDESLEAKSLRSIIASAPVRARSLALLNSELQSSHAFYDVTNIESATAAMAQTIKDAVQRSGGELRSLTIDPVTQVNGLDKLELGLDIVVGAQGLPGLLNAFEAARPFLMMSSLTISAAQFGPADGQLWIEIKISAFRRSPNGAI